MLNLMKKLVDYTGNYSTYVKTKKGENEVNQMKTYHKQQEIAHIEKWLLGLFYMPVVGRLSSL